VIARYTRPVMGSIWAEENRFRAWLKVELAATETLAEAGYTSSIYGLHGKRDSIRQAASLGQALKVWEQR